MPRMLYYLCDPGSPNEWGAERYKRLYKEDPKVTRWVEAGLRFALGENMEPDFARAAKWFREAARKGSPYGQYWLANLTMVGYGQEKNLPLAHYWIRKAAKQGYPRPNML